MEKQKVKVISYTFGIFSNLEQEVWLNKILKENPDYTLISVVDNQYWSPGGGTSWRTAYLLLK